MAQVAVRLLKKNTSKSKSVQENFSVQHSKDSYKSICQPLEHRSFREIMQVNILFLNSVYTFTPVFCFYFLIGNISKPKGKNSLLWDSVILFGLKASDL